MMSQPSSYTLFFFSLRLKSFGFISLKELFMYWPDFTLPPINLKVMPPYEPPKKKCIKECRLDRETKTCIGCKRTLEEIKEAGLKASR